MPSVLALGAAGGGGAIGVAQRDCPVQPVRERPGGFRGLLGFVLQQGQHFRRQCSKLADRHGSDVPQSGTVGRGIHYAASSLIIWVAKSGSAPWRRGRVMAR
jgi:hypothetical protein